VDYTTKDYASFREDLINAIPDRLPEWTSRSPGDFGIVLIELFSMIGDILSYYGDRIVNESFLATAVLRSSVIKHAQLIDYRPHDATGARVTLRFTNTLGVPAPIPKGTQVTTTSTAGTDPVVFETDADLLVDASDSATVSATQGVTFLNESIGSSSGNYDQRFTLFQSPVIEGSVKVYVDEGLGPREWTFFSHLTDAASSDPAFTTETNENSIVSVIFGDGTNGRIPVTGSIITATYRVGGGEIGNVGTGALTEMAANIPGVTVLNETPASGGAEAETIEHIRTQAPKSLKAQDRAVTLEDYAALALKVSGVAKAKAQADVYTAVRLYVNPVGGFFEADLEDRVDALTPSLTNSSGTGYLDDKKMINTTITVHPPEYLGAPGYVPIEIEADVTVLPQYSSSVVASHVKETVLDVLSFDKVDFGQRVTLSSIYQVISKVEGVDFAVVTVLRIDGTTPPVDAADIVVPPTGIPKTDSALVTINPLGGL
jgi:uncharacterized phage protein gp47/JayE